MFRRRFFTTLIPAERTPRSRPWLSHQTRPWCFSSASSAWPQRRCLDFSSSHTDGRSAKTKTPPSENTARTPENNLTTNGRQTLLRATMKGHFFSFSRLMDSSVWGSRPCMMSTTRMAMSHRELPLFLRLLETQRVDLQTRTDLKPNHRSFLTQLYLKDSCPGVSMINMPGILMLSFSNCANKLESEHKANSDITSACLRFVAILRF